MNVRDVDVAKSSAHLSRQGVLREVTDDGGLGGYAHEANRQPSGEHEDSSHGASLPVGDYAIASGKATGFVGCGVWSVECGVWSVDDLLRGDRQRVFSLTDFVTS
jgi:hypothetical protein